MKYFKMRFDLERLMREMDQSEYIDKQEAVRAYREALGLAMTFSGFYGYNIDSSFDYEKNKVTFIFNDNDHEIENDDYDKIEFDEFEIVLDYKDGVEDFEDYSEIYEDGLQRYSIYRQGIFGNAKEYFEKLLKELMKLDINKLIKEDFENHLLNVIDEADSLDSHFHKFTENVEW